MNSENNGNNSEIRTCFGRSRDCMVYTFTMTFSTFIFFSIMILTVFLIHTSNLDKAVVVLLVGSCLIFLLGIIGNSYSVYYLKPIGVALENAENSNRSSQTVDSSAQGTSTNVRAPDVVSFPRSGLLFRTPPPPPYEIQMSAMSRMQLPGTSRIHESSTREAEIAEEARRMIERLYEGMRRTDPLVTQPSIAVQPLQQSTPKTHIRQQKTMSPRVSQQNLIVQKQQAVAKSSPSRGISPVGFRSIGVNPVGSSWCSKSNHPLGSNWSSTSSSPVGANPDIQQKVAQSSLPTQLNLSRLMVGSEGCSTVNSQPPFCIPGRPTVDFRTNQDIQQRMTPNSSPTQPELERFIICSDGCAMANPQMSPRREAILKVALKRKLTSPSQDLQARPKPQGSITHMAAVDMNSQSNEYEEIENVENIQSMNSSPDACDPGEFYCSTASEFGETSEQSSSVDSVTSEPNLEERKNFRFRNFQSPSLKEPRQLSMFTTRKFCQLGSSPQSVLNAIATCSEMNGDEWMAAWNLSLNNVPPVERARILGLRLHEDSYNADN